MGTIDPRADLSTAQVISWAAVSTEIQDKYSIEDQLKLERDWCKKVGATLVDELIVRGFSRDYWTLADVIAASAHDPDMEAFARLQAHIRKHDFNVFLCFDADRFGRTQSLIHEVLGRITRDCQALVYTLVDGIWMDEESAPMIGTLKAYKSQHDVTRLKVYRVKGMDNRAKDGKSTSAIMPLFHQRVRDSKGDELGVVVNEELRALWTDTATLLLRGVSWEQLEIALFEEFGHGEQGKPYRLNRIRDLIRMPAWWGHAALNYRFVGQKRTPGGDPWIWDEHVSPPENVTVYRNRLPAVYGGQWADIGELVKEELWRRYRLKGKATPANTYRFHGMVVCDECGYTMMLARGGQQARTYMRCETRYRVREHRHPADCSQTKFVPGKHIQQFLHVQLQNALNGEASILFDVLHNAEPLQWRVDEEQEQLTRLEKRANALVHELTDAEENLRPIFRRQLHEVSGSIEKSTQTLEALRLEMGATQDYQRAQSRSMDYFRSITLDEFWKLPDTAIHQILSVTLGRNQLVAREGRIIAITPSKSAYVLSERRHGLDNV